MRKNEYPVVDLYSIGQEMIRASQENSKSWLRVGLISMECQNKINLVYQK